MTFSIQRCVPISSALSQLLAYGITRQ